jgi:RimJ/RimL family protein N-acetyltransferase
MIPTLTTDRLTLRPYARADFDTYAAFLASDRATYMGGPHNAETAWAWFTNDIASWALYGFGNFAIEKDGQLAGFTGLVHPPTFPEPECGWFLMDGFEGQGIATEAARATIAHTFATTDLTTCVSNVDPANTASAAIALRLGATLDKNAAIPSDEPAGSCDVYRHIKGGLK